MMPKKESDSLPLIPKHYLEFQNNSKGYCIVKGNTTKKQIALTFDDGPTDISFKIIQILNKHNVKATFFWLGKNLDQNKEVIKLAEYSGHQIANHSWDHENGWQLSNTELWSRQVEKSLKEFERTGLGKSSYYRPPYGAITQNQIDYLAAKNIKTILWSITTMDWDPNQNQEGEMFEKFKNHLHNGAIVLLHDFDFGNINAKIKDLEQMIIYGKTKGYNFVNVQNVL
jgi:peptidoglycan/xylan/chitin deacetylase (PgdA/CDA1 family)